MLTPTPALPVTTTLPALACGDSSCDLGDGSGPSTPGRRISHPFGPDGWHSVTAWADRPWLCIDTETTGVVPGIDRVVEVAAAVMLAGDVIDSAWSMVHPGIPIPSGASTIHGITDDDVRDCPPLAELAPGILAYFGEWIGRGAIVVGYNVVFDLRMLAGECTSFGDLLLSAPCLDARPIVGHLAPLGRGRGRQTLGAVSRHYGLLPRGDLHRALSDAVLAGDLLLCLRAELPADLTAATAQVSAWRNAQDADWQRYTAERQAQAELDALRRMV